MNTLYYCAFFSLLQHILLKRILKNFSPDNDLNLKLVENNSKSINK